MIQPKWYCFHSQRICFGRKINASIIELTETQPPNRRLFVHSVRLDNAPIYKWPRNRFQAENYTFGQSLSCSVISLKPIKHRDATRDECGVKSKHKSNVNYIISVLCSRCEQYERLMNQTPSTRNYHPVNQQHQQLFLSTRCSSGFCTQNISFSHRIIPYLFVIINQTESHHCVNKGPWALKWQTKIN